MTLTHDDRRHMEVLGELLAIQDNGIAIYSHANGDRNREIANVYRARASAIRWAIREIEGLQAEVRGLEAEVRAFKAAEVVE